tara:strand:+ start:283 stop:969 length:687 start_codon:yes stop_codon:yes gene_type:complete
MKSNIYDIHLSEIELRLEASLAGSAANARLELSSSIGIDTVAENYNSTETFRSKVVNKPTGYTVKTGTHIITAPTAPITSTNSTEDFTTTGNQVILGAAGSTYVVSSTITLEKSGELDIVLTDTLTITSVSPIAYGVKTYDVSPDISSLNIQSNEDFSFDLTSTSIGRLLVAIPTADDDMIAIEDSNGNIWPASDFTKTISGGHDIWQLNYDTQFTGSYIKSFTIKTI